MEQIGNLYQEERHGMKNDVNALSELQKLIDFTLP